MFNNKLFWIAIVLVLAAFILDYAFDGAEVVKTTESMTDFKGKTETIDVFTFSHTYKLLALASNLLYTIGISIGIYFGIEHQLGKKEAEKNKEELNKLQQQINENIFNGVLKKLIPEDLFDILARDILNSSIIRKNARWNYDIKENKAGTGYIMTQVISYDVQNISNQSINAPIDISVSHTSHCKGYIQYLKIYKKKAIHTQYDAAELEKRKIEIEKGLKSSVEVEIEPKEVITVTQTVVNEYSNLCVVDAHISSYSVLGLTISVNNKPTDCDFYLIPTFTEKLSPTIPTPTRIDYDTLKGILVGQGVIFFMEKKRINLESKT